MTLTLNPRAPEFKPHQSQLSSWASPSLDDDLDLEQEMASQLGLNWSASEWQPTHQDLAELEAMENFNHTMAKLEEAEQAQEAYYLVTQRMEALQQQLGASHLQHTSASPQALGLRDNTRYYPHPNHRETRAPVPKAPPSHRAYMARSPRTMVIQQPRGAYQGS